MFSSLLASGYAVAFINYTGSLGQGEKSINDLIGKIGERDINDCLRLMDQVLQADPQLGKVFLWGGSHGGYIVTMLIGQYPERNWNGAIIRNPVTDYYSTKL